VLLGIAFVVSTMVGYQRANAHLARHQKSVAGFERIRVANRSIGSFNYYAGNDPVSNRKTWEDLCSHNWSVLVGSLLVSGCTWMLLREKEKLAKKRFLNSGPDIGHDPASEQTP
jgi:hypothetical protein